MKLVSDHLKGSTVLGQEPPTPDNSEEEASQARLKLKRKAASCCLYAEGRQLLQNQCNLHVVGAGKGKCVGHKLQTLLSLACLAQNTHVSKGLVRLHVLAII